MSEHPTFGFASSAPSPSVDTRRFPWKGHRFGRLIVTVCRQGSGSPLIDNAWTTDREGYRYASRAILLKPWLRDRHGQRLRQKALVVGWRQET